MNTQVIQGAIDACSESGGGTVSLPPGIHRAGTIHLRNDVTLHLPATATLLQSTDMADYEFAPQSCYVHGTGSRYVFLHGDRVKNVALVGEGTIDGNLALDSSDRGGDRRGPLPILFENSRNILIKDITVRNSPSWAITLFGCNKVDLICVKCLDSWADGINPVCSQDVCLDRVLIEGSKDDAIAIKNEMAGAAPDCGFLTEDIVVKNSTIRNCKHPAVKIGTGTFGIFKNITVANCTFESTGAMLVIQLMSPERDDTPERTIENVTFSDIVMKNVSGLIDVTSLTVGRAIIKNICLENIVADGLKGRSAIWGLAEAPIENVVLRNISISGSAEAVHYWYDDMLPEITKPAPYWLKTRHLNGLTLCNVDLLLDEVDSGLICENGSDVNLNRLVVRDVAGKEGAGPVVTLNQVSKVLIEKSKGPAGRTFIRTLGERTGGIRIENNEWDETKVPLEVESDLFQEDVIPSAGEVMATDLEVSSLSMMGAGFSARVTFANSGNEGSFKAEVLVDGDPAGSRWLWLKKGERRQVTLRTSSFYEPRSYRFSVGSLAETVEVHPVPAKFEFGEQMQIRSPATAGELTVVTVPLKNVGGRSGSKEVNLLADGEVVASTRVALDAGEEKEITLQHRFSEVGPHTLKVGDFPSWPYATFANCSASFFQTREKIIIEAGGGEHHILRSDRQYAALYLKAVKGDFVSTTMLSVRHVTGPYCGGGLIVKNNMADPSDHSGCVIDWFYPKYAVCHYEVEQHRQIKKEGREFSALHRISPEDADTVQDVGIFVNAFSARRELCHVEFDQFAVEQK
jgi:hypothetical protein